MAGFIRSLTLILVILGTSLILFARGSQSGKAGQASYAKEIITLPGAKTSGLPFSSAVKFGNTMFLSGVIGTDLKTNELVSQDVGDQTCQCLEKLKSILIQGGMNLGDAVNATVYLTDLNDYDAMNKAYAAYFTDNPPARACVQVAKLVRGAKVEISMIAMKAK